MTTKPMLGNSATDEEVKDLTRPELLTNLKHASDVHIAIIMQLIAINFILFI